MNAKQTRTPRNTDKNAINEATLKNLDSIPTRMENKDDKRFTAISLHTYVSALTSAMVSAKYALLLELSVSLAVYYENKGASRDAKRSIAVIYNQAGWNNLDPKDEDYKTVQRRIGVSGLLYDWLGESQIGEWLEGVHEMQAIQKISHSLEEYDLRGMNSVLALVGKPVKRVSPKEKEQEKTKAAQAQAKEQPKAEEKKPEQPAKEGPKVDWSGTEHGGAEQQGNVTQLRRRTDDVAEEGTLFIVTQHLKIAIPPETTKDEMLQAAQELLMRASRMDGDIIADVPQEAAEEIQEELPGDDIGNKAPEKAPAAPADPAKLAALVTERQKGRRIK